MISFLRGKIKLVRSGIIILDVLGVGYKVLVDQNIPLRENAEVEFFVHEHIKEDVDDLYGFKTWEELELFERLISVNGVGPKAGMAIMSAGKPDKVISSIVSDDLTFFTGISGIGKKVAAKIILDLKSKLSGLDGSDVILGVDRENDVLMALISLGYKKSEVAKIVSGIPADIATDQEKIRWCLKQLKK
ncbi:MAG: Holliday junction ATP-dependent DNA helicase RuvA [bacterium ADurb.BinA186]|nr:MAG: Holliday junction ATP-dependent DNA helicase RuvA [bacterium ADurb.BinA186]